MDSTSIAIDQLLTQIRPGLTLYALIVTFAVIAFWVGKFFWNYEEKLKDENVERIRAMMQRFRTLYIEPVIQLGLTEFYKGGYSLALQELVLSIFKPQAGTTGTLTHQLIDENNLKQYLDYERLINTQPDDIKISTLAQEYSSSKTGMEFLDRLDAMYAQKEVIISAYSKASRSAGNTCYIFFGLSFILILGLTAAIISYPPIIKYFWFFACVSLLFAGLICFVRMETNRRNLLRTWEKLEFYGQI